MALNEAKTRSGTSLLGTISLLSLFSESSFLEGKGFGKLVGSFRKVLNHFNT